MEDSSNRSDSRRQFLETTAVGAIGLSTGMFDPSLLAQDELDAPGSLSVVSNRTIRKGSQDDLHLRLEGNVDLAAGAKLWLFYDIRQGAAIAQTDKATSANFLSVTVVGSNKPAGKLRMPTIPRTFDLLPAVPEFLHLIELTLDGPVAAGKAIDFVIRRWTGPKQPIDPYRFWLVVDHKAQWQFPKSGYARYYHFVMREGKQRIPPENLFAQTVTTALTVTGEYRPVPKISHRRTPGVFWGEFHGMVFNQRPFDDYYNYARHVTKLDFCAPFGFSYNTCVGNVWDEVKAAAARHTEPGNFIAIAGFECGTPPDGSHRCIVFRDPDNVPPILCEHRQPALEKHFLDRLHPDTIICKTVDQLYETVAKYGGMITGHYHTRVHHAEVLREIFQKNLHDSPAEEQRLYKLLREGKRFALAGTSDTHDSMPGNPYPETHGVTMPAGFTGVHANELTIDALFEAVLARRIYATSGARIFMNFHSNNRPMGAELAKDAQRQFEIEIDGTAKLQTVELLRDGRPIQQWTPGWTAFSITTADTNFDESKTAFYLVRVTQEDEHRGWTSPIWFG